MNEREEMKVTCIEPDQQALVTLANIEYRISVHMQGTYREILAVGRCLVEAKEAGLVPHGQWEEWVRRNTGMSERQAQRLMQAARNVLMGRLSMALRRADRSPWPILSGLAFISSLLRAEQSAFTRFFSSFSNCLPDFASAASTSWTRRAASACTSIASRRVASCAA